MAERSNDVYVISVGICPDEKCKMKLYFPNIDKTVLCYQCGQRHEKDALKNVENITDIDSVFHNVIRGMLMNALSKRGTEAVKVLGLSNYHCKLLSPLLTQHGMDKETGKAKPLSEMNQGDIFDCGLFGDRAFLIDPEHISIEGFGRDLSGSMKYLRSTLELIKANNNKEEGLVPIHADGDGHCLVHAISRALVGRELFWHPLRCSLKRHLEGNLPAYKELFKEFVDESDWKAIVDECDPEFLPPEGEPLGLRNIHVFGLANVLKRPIILLDSVEYMDKTGDYAALFLPSMVEPESCRGKDNHLNKPLCIAWSSEGHNHYIPLVGIKKSPLPVLSRQLLPKVWGVPQEQIDRYIEFDENDCCAIGGDRSLGDPYILRLVSAMEELFQKLHDVHPSLVSDVHHYLYASTGAVNVRPNEIITRTRNAVWDGRLYRCFTCNAINEQVLAPEWFKRTGLLYNMALRTHGVLRATQLYAFPARGIFCKYDDKTDELVPDLEQSALEKCSCCEGVLVRKVKSDGSIVYKNRDRTKTPSESTHCSCGFKHYWDGKEYDNIPNRLNVVLKWDNRVVNDTVMWFENESDSSLNSNAYKVASEVVQKHFPGLFGTDGLQQSVVEQILNQTKRPEIRSAANLMGSLPPIVPQDGCSPSKIILGGAGIIHREELGVSVTEKGIRHRIKIRAHVQQQRQALAKSESHEKSSAVVSAKVDRNKTYSQNINKPSAQKITESSKFVKVATSDGREGKLELGEGITFETLQKWICDNFQISPDNQTLRYGFPPQMLCASAERGTILPLSPGERIIVEVSQPSESLETQSDADLYDNSSLLPSDWQKLVENFTRSMQDPLENKVSSFQLSASLNDLPPWEYAKTVPDVFESGGIFYNLIKRDIGLNEKRHGQLAIFPGKVFAYNPDCDRIELCFEPYGHHQIKLGLEEKILRCEKEKNLQICSSVGRNCSMTGNVRRHTDRVPFQGTGYTLKGSEVKSPQKESIAADGDDAFKVPFKPSSSVLVRKGPGFSVLSHNVIPPENTDLDRLQGLASEIVRDSLLEEQQPHGRPSLKKSSGQVLSSRRSMPDEMQQLESPTPLLSQTAHNKDEMSSSENEFTVDMPENSQELVSGNGVHIPLGKDENLPESHSSNEKEASSSHDDSSDHPMDDVTRDCENMDMVLGKGDDETLCLTSTALERNLDLPDETQAMDVDRVGT